VKYVVLVASVNVAVARVSDARGMDAAW